MSERDVVAIAIVVLLGACAGPSVPPRPPPAHAAEAAACPLGVDGASVRTENTERGIALVLSASGDDVLILRERARDAAKLHGPFGRLGKGHDGRHGTGGQHGLAALSLPASRATAEDISGGARIEIIPTHSSDKEMLRDRVRERARIMSTMPCDVAASRAGL